MVGFWNQSIYKIRYDIFNLSSIVVGLSLGMGRLRTGVGKVSGIGLESFFRVMITVIDNRFGYCRNWRVSSWLRIEFSIFSFKGMTIGNILFAFSLTLFDYGTSSGWIFEYIRSSLSWLSLSWRYFEFEELKMNYLLRWRCRRNLEFPFSIFEIGEIMKYIIEYMEFQRTVTINLVLSYLFIISY